MKCKGEKGERGEWKGGYFRKILIITLPVSLFTLFTPKGGKIFHKPEGYKELLVYKRAVELLEFVYKITEKYPWDEKRRKEHMRDSARSNKQNIVEGWKRSTTKEYHDFLSFSLGSLAELKEDGEDSIKFGLITQAEFEELMDRCREEDFLLNRLQLSLKNKMEQEGTMPLRNRYRAMRQGEEEKKKEWEKYMENLGYIHLENGQYVKRDEKGDGGGKGK